MVYRWAVGRCANRALALEAWARAKQTFLAQAIPFQGMVIHHDRDPVYTGYTWTGQLVVTDRVHLSCTLNGAKDNPETESFIGRFKTEKHSLFLDAQSIDELEAVVAARIDCYNRERGIRASATGRP